MDPTHCLKMAGQSIRLIMGTIFDPTVNNLDVFDYQITDNCPVLHWVVVDVTLYWGCTAQTW